MIWTAFSLEIARRGRQSNIWFLNLVYDFTIWGLLLAFGILIVVMVASHMGDVDQQLCDGKNRGVYALCDAMMFQLLAAQLVMSSLGFLIA